MTTKSIFLLIMSLVILIDGKPIETKYMSILDDIPEEERYEFLRYNLNRGFQLAHQQNNTSDTPIELAPEDSINLYEYLLTNYRITDEERIEAMKNVVCFDELGCIDLDDPGIFPK